VGGFAPGAPVQPVLLDYSANTRFNPGWGLDESTPWHMWRLLTQLRTYIRLEILPVRSDLCFGCFFLGLLSPIFQVLHDAHGGALNPQSSSWRNVMCFVRT